VWGPVTAFLVFTLFPVYWLVNSSLKGAGELFTFPPRYWPAAATIANYLDAVRQTRLAALYLNSLWISSVTCLALMALIVFSGYAMARFRFRGKAWLVALFLLAQVLPHVVLLLPFFTMFKVAGLINTRLALVIAYTVITLPFSVLTMRGFFAAIPVELDEAAMVDGCGRSGALFRVVLPAALPGLVATSIYGFINAWNELILAVVLINSPNLQTLPVGLSSLIDENRTEYGMLMAVAVLSLVPSLVFFGWIQRYLTTGLSAGAVKG
jgi:multiple sugar transport system permease protein